MADPARLLALAEAVADGQAVDWSGEEGHGPDHERELVRQLKLIAGVATTHRSVDSGTEPPASLVDVPRSWGTLDIEALIGHGSFGTVFRAWDRRLARHVALKLLQNDNADSEIVEEGRLLAQVHHSHVITVHGADRFDGRAGIWMELVNGRTLQEIVAENGPFGAREAVLIGLEVSSALAAVHGAGLVHGDVKAQNVMREEGGRTLLMDFGAGGERESATGRRAGTPLYMAPEVLAGGTNSVLSDIYALGVLLFYLVTAEYPAGGPRHEIRALRQRGSARRHMQDLRPDTPEWFMRIVNRALASDPRERFQTAGEFHDALADGLNGTAQRPARRRRAAWMAVVTALSAIAVVISAGAWLRTTDGGPPAVHSIAVVPFVNLTGDREQDRVAAGLTDELVANLGRMKELRIVPIGASAHGPTSTASIAGLGVDAMLEGSIQRTATRVRVAVRLVQRQPASGSVLWSQVYEGPLADATPIQGRIAIDLTRHLGITVDEHVRAAVTRYAPSQAVQDAYLRGRFLMATNNRHETPQARTEFERAIALDPTYAPAHAALAQTFLSMGAYGQLEPAEVRRRALQAAQAAVALDPMLADAALAMADVRFRVEWDWAGADAAYLTAIDLNPSDVQARSRYARYLAAAGRTADALEQARRAYALDPLSDEIYALVGMMMYYERRHEDAISHFAARQDDSVPRYVGLARAQSELGRYADAITALERALALSGHDRSIYAELGRVCARGGHVARARQILAELTALRRSPGDYIAPQDLAYIHAALGDREGALRLLHEAAGEQSFRLLWLGVDPRVDTLRSDPEFGVVRQRLGIPG